jgi:hypothetical protein
VTRSGITRLGTVFANILLTAAAVTIAQHLAAPNAQAFPHYTNFGGGHHDWIVLSTPATTVWGIAADSVSETGQAAGVAAFEYLESGRLGRHLSVEAEFRGASYTYDEVGNVVGLILSGVATVTDVPTGTTSDALLELVSDHDGVRVLLTGADWQLPFEVTPPGDPLAVETPGGLEVAMAAAATRIGPNGELDTMAAGVVRLSTGDVLGLAEDRQESGREPFTAVSVIDRLRVRERKGAVVFDLRGTATVLTAEGMCVAAVDKDFLMPVEDVFTISGRGTVNVPRCGVRMQMSEDERGVSLSRGFGFVTGETR